MHVAHERRPPKVVSLSPESFRVSAVPMTVESGQKQKSRIAAIPDITIRELRPCRQD